MVLLFIHLNIHTMRRVITIVLFSALLAEASGQFTDRKWMVGLLVGKTEYNGDLGSSFFRFDPFHGMGAFTLTRYIDPLFDVGLMTELGNYGYTKGTEGFQARKFDVSLLLSLKFNNGIDWREDALIAPYLAMGAGVAGFAGTRTDKTGVDFVFPVGGGVKVNIKPGMALQYQLLYYLTNGDTRDLVDNNSSDAFLSHTFGVVIGFGKAKDTDNDGVPDKTDLCPGTPAGVAVAPDGCPLDGDNDGIADYLDACPTVFGMTALKGCPDTDGDGIQDSQDKCPKIKGLASLNGCPDADGDGITDAEDKCPDVKGLAAFDGCPDTDGDGITDSEDRCPAEKGSKEMKGCPDSDNDGIADPDDRCPTVAGISENKGCPAIKEEVIEVFTRALTGIQFETGKDIIRPNSYPILDNVVTIMNENPEYNLEINGHTDAVGDDAMNLDLSQRRAEAVKKYMAGKGINEVRMTARGFGETMPVADNNTAAGRAKNRRVEFKVVF